MVDGYQSKDRSAGPMAAILLLKTAENFSWAHRESVHLMMISRVEIKTLD